MKECIGEAKEEGEFDEMTNSGGMAQKAFIFIRLLVLRKVSLANVCVRVCVCINTLAMSNFCAAVFGARALH